MSNATSEDQIETYNLELLQALGYAYQNGYDIEPEGSRPNRQSFSDILLKDCLQLTIWQVLSHYSDNNIQVVTLKPKR